MAFKRYKGLTKTVWLPVTTSTVLSKDSIVSWSSGLLIAATSSTTALSHAGVTSRAIVATDSDYATARVIPVIVPVEKNVWWSADFTTGLVTTDLGAECDLTDAVTVNRGASSVDTCIIQGYISTTKGYVLINFYAGKA